MLVIRPEIQTGIHTLDLGETMIIFDKAIIVDGNTLHLYRNNLIVSSIINLSNMDIAHIKNVCKNNNIELEVKEQWNH